jgi:thioredoxin 1
MNSPIQTLSVSDFQTALTEWPNAQLVDVRTPAELADMGHLPNAMNIPVQELDKTRSVMVYCQHGVRSMNAALFLSEQGFGPIGNLDGGFALWNGEISHEPPAPTPVKQAIC